MQEPVLNEFGGQETNLGESRRGPVVCMLINSHDLFNGVAVSEGCEAWRGCREANTGLVPSAEMVRRFFPFKRSQEGVSVQIERTQAANYNIRTEPRRKGKNPCGGKCLEDLVAQSEQTVLF